MTAFRTPVRHDPPRKPIRSVATGFLIQSAAMPGESSSYTFVGLCSQRTLRHAPEIHANSGTSHPRRFS